MRSNQPHERYDVDENLRQVEIPDMIVPVDYLSNSKEETLLFSTDRLVSDMIVLVEPPKLRAWDANVIGRLEPADRITALHAMRWCRIEEIETLKTPRSMLSPSCSIVRFLGLYADGSRATREYGLPVGWYVKNASIPKTGTQKSPSE